MTQAGSHDATAARDALALLATAPAITSAQCIDDEILVAWFETRLTGAEAQRVKHHVARCERCFELWSALCDTRPTPKRAPSLWTRLVSRWHARAPWQPVAAGAMLMLLGVFVGSQMMRVDTPALVAYELAVQGSDAWRGDDTSADTNAVMLRAGSRFELTLRPATAFTETPVVRLFDARRSPPLALDAPAASNAGQGTMVLRATVSDDILLPVGRTPIIVAIGLSDALPPADILLDALATRTEARGDGWQAWRVVVDLKP